LVLELPVEPLVLPDPEPSVPLELEPMPVLEDGLVVELELDGLVLEPLLEPCSRSQSAFAVPVSVSQLVLELEPDVLLGLELELLELGLELGLVLEPVLLLGLVVLLLEPVLLLGLVVLLGLVLELPLPALPELWASDTVARPASAAATARPSAFFIIGRLLRSWRKMLRAIGSKRRAAASRSRPFMV
jgi:hypothetical protein